MILFKKRTNFLLFAEKYINDNAHLYKPRTIASYKSQLNKLSRFKPILYIEQIDFNFLMAYQKHMIVDLKNKPSTYYKSLSWIRSMLNNAVRNGILKQNTAFNKFPIKKTNGNRAHLNTKELERLTRYYEHTKLTGQKNVLAYFLFSCYTGLRYVDIIQLRKSNIHDNMIILNQLKTDKPVKVPLINKAKALIDYESESQYIFNAISNQKTNKHLKKIATACHINKELTFHVARHTFATLGLTLGIPLEVVSKLLGHTDIKTTQIYAQVREDLLIKEMRKFDAI